jgi:hypothetical protein
MQKTMTNVEQHARLIAMDEAVVAAIRLHAPEFEAAYLADDLPRWFQRLLDGCTVTAEHVADRADDDAFIEILSALLGDTLGHGQVMADHDAPGIVPEARSSGAPVCSSLNNGHAANSAAVPKCARPEVDRLIQSARKCGGLGIQVTHGTSMRTIGCDPNQVAQNCILPQANKASCASDSTPSASSGTFSNCPQADNKPSSG